jgi:virulence factor
VIAPLVNRFKNFRKQKYFDNTLFTSKKKYAFVGIGIHSLANIYPILHHFGISVKYIYTRSSKWDSQMKRLFKESRFIHSITEIIDDQEVEGVFVCATPTAHFEILKKLLDGGKKVFIEKPPCQNLSELNILTQFGPKAVCKIGLQRRYWAGNKYLRSIADSAISYNYVFHFGKYVGGNTYTELFIHAFDYCLFVFGDYKLLSFSNHINNEGTTVQLHVRHSNGISGLIEVSSEFSWNAPTDQLTINCKRETIEVRYPMEINAIQKPKHLFGVPAERLLNEPLTTKKYFSAGNLLAPVPELNTLVLLGFYQEIKTFVDIVEGRMTKTVLNNDLPSMRNTFETIDQLQHSERTT